MADNKKYYYIRLNENFFEREEIKIIESLPNGLEYSLILLKMYLKSLKRNGRLMATDLIPYSPETLSRVLGHNVDTVRNAIRVFEEFKLIEVLDNGAIYMNEIQSLIGKSSTEADRKREYRKRINEEKKLLSEGKKENEESDKSLDKSPKIKKEPSNNATSKNKVGQMSDECSRETETETETELETELQQQIQRLVNCDAREAKIICNVAKQCQSNRNVVDVVVEKINIINSGNFRNKIGALVSAIKENWTVSTVDNTNTFNNFQSRDYNNEYGKLLEKILNGQSTDEDKKRFNELEGVR